MSNDIPWARSAEHIVKKDEGEIVRVVRQPS